MPRRRVPFVLLVAIVVVVAASASIDAMAQTSAAPSATVGATEVTTQLPRNVRPLHYDIAVAPHAGSMSFDGHAKIDVEVLEPTASITLNALDLTFASARLLAKAGATRFSAPKIEVDAKAQTASFTFAQVLPAGAYTLDLDYSGKIYTQANGLFAIDYDTKAGKKRALYTQFENSDARRFMPCWDEPNYKATFALEATVPASQMAVSNMPVVSRTAAGKGSIRVRFALSPKMSTYLLFFGAGDFERATAKLGNTEIGVVAQKGHAKQAKYALDSTVDILREYNTYFDTPYPLPKLDNVASPGGSQFFSAMENWGAIYTFEYALLLDPSISAASDKQNVFTTAAHEVAHQWFGNLVTMRWWDDLWLNEGFASWMEGRTTAKLHPEWNAELSAVSVRNSAMNRDALRATHPVVQHVETVEQASQAFDSITYSKGESVIRMLEAYVGDDAWRRGVRNYMKTHAYGNAVSNDLWAAVEAAAGKPIVAIARDFTTQPGVPLIRVESAECAAGNTVLKLTQGEFTKDRPDKTPLRWRVPVIAQVVGSAPANALIDGGEGTMTLPGCGPVVVNAGQSGYYRVMYKPELFAGIKARFARLKSIDQLGLMSDIWALGMNGSQPASDYLELAEAVPVNAGPQVWGNVVANVSDLNDYYRDDSATQAAFQRYAIQTLRPLLARLGWSARGKESDQIAILRSDVIETLGELGDADVVAEVRRRYAKRNADPHAMPAELRKTILTALAYNAEPATWDALHADARAEKTPLVKDELYELLCLAKDERLARRALELALTDEPGATNSAGMISIVSRNHPELAFEYATEHRAQVDRFVDAASMSQYYPELAGRSSKIETIEKLKAFAEANIAPNARRVADREAGNIAYRASVRERRLPQIDAWLKRRGG